jgi:hypothetical protein
VPGLGLEQLEALLLVGGKSQRSLRDPEETRRARPLGNPQLFICHLSRALPLARVQECADARRAMRANSHVESNRRKFSSTAALC